MKRIISIIAFVSLFAAMAAFGGHMSAAHADPTGNETCGGLVTADPTPDWSSTTNTWFFDVLWNCGTGKTFTMEVQHTTNGGATYSDWGTEHGHSSPAGCNNGCGPLLITWSGTCAVTGSYRYVTNNNSGVSDRSDWRGAGLVCQ